VAIALAAALRDISRETWRTKDPHGIDAAAIEHLDAKSLAILRQDGVPSRLNVTLPPEAGAGLLVQLELPPGTSSASAYDEISGALGDDAPDGPLVRFCRMLDRFGVLDTTELAAPDDRRRLEQLIALREAIATGVNHRVAIAKHTYDPRIAKVSGDMIVPFERFEEMMGIYRYGLEARGLDHVIYGHISDGNVHPNVLPKSFADVVSAREAMLEFGREVTRLGGCPLAEHGVGRNPVKQALLRQLYGERGIEQMRAVKLALDPDWKLAPGVIFPAYAPLPT
jgi:D-lactate dehydrogenase (cytochrome)